MAPKMMGSLILKMPGTTQARPRAFSSLDLQMNIINRQRDSVQPTPPIHR